MENLTPPTLPFKYSNEFKPYYFSDRENMIRIAMEYVKSSKLAGDYFEFGVHMGATFQAAYHFAQRESQTAMRFHAFDSFEGMPKSEGVDSEDALYQFIEGQYACSEAAFKQSVAANSVDLTKITSTKGWFNDTLNDATKNQLGAEKAAVVWVDCDLYASTFPVLAFISDYLQTGTILCFDDWFSFMGRADRGEQKAFNEWRAQHPNMQFVDYHVFGKWGKSFIVLRD